MFFSTSAAKDKIALVIGASQYEIHNRPLPASKYDAREISSILKALGFSVRRLCCGSKEMRSPFRETFEKI